MEKVKKSAVRIFSGQTTVDLEQQIECVLNKNEDFYIQSVSISHDETWIYAAVVFNTEQPKRDY